MFWTAVGILAYWFWLQPPGKQPFTVVNSMDDVGVVSRGGEVDLGRRFCVKDPEGLNIHYRHSYRLFADKAAEDQGRGVEVITPEPDRIVFGHLRGGCQFYPLRYHIPDSLGPGLYDIRAEGFTARNPLRDDAWELPPVRFEVAGPQ